MRTRSCEDYALQRPSQIAVTRHLDKELNYKIRRKSLRILFMSGMAQRLSKQAYRRFAGMSCCGVTDATRSQSHARRRRPPGGQRGELPPSNRRPLRRELPDRDAEA